ncbi:dinitrogenase iron-molybdenum cofactor biosynthesis protein [Candidatus Micrarchaeota archaeon]|mgnify:CR=1 FL=1|nr:MAG: dinitrogenase iron-molybdenum cofactor biosynthesis protein [Candidatus Micrarchaeota archaeon]
MKIAISTSKGGLDDTIAPVFGRCPTFTLVSVDEKSKSIADSEILPNPAARAGGGAGPLAAQTILDTDSTSVITGNCGPNAMAVLMQANISIYSASGTVKKAVEDFLAGKLSPIDAPSTPPHFGMGRRFRGGFGGGRRFRGGGP